MSAADRLAAIAARAAVRRIDPDLLGRFVREFGEAGRLPDGPADLGRSRPTPGDVVLVEQVRAAVLDVEEAAYLACGGDPNGTWLGLVDAARAGQPGADELLRHHGVGSFGRWPGLLAQVFVGQPGNEAIRVAHPPEPQPEAPLAPAPRRRARSGAATP